ncbi:MAG: uroporphyrinogen decarboxylase family protein [Capsulimonadaceae bacterium]|nr:uroporphyrinogen decarboxylase family protein [Capsulimonadaceae bacterium]
MTKPLTSRDRVRTTLAHCEPDRVPIDYVGNGGINRRLMAHFGLGGSDYGGLLDALNVDFRTVGAPYSGPRLHAEIPGKNVDPCWGIQTVWIEHESGGYNDYTGWPLKDASEELLRTWPMPSPDDYDYSAIPAQIARNPDKCIVLGGAGGPDIINSTGMIRTMEQTLLDLATEDEAALAFIDRRIDILHEVMARSLEAAGGRIDLIWMGEDLGTQKGPMISVPMFRKLIRPRHQKVVDLAKSFGVPVMIHSCGSSSWAFDDFAEMGISVVDTLQPEAADMAPAYLKDRYGSKLCFHGCISTAGPVAYGSVQDVVDVCRETLAVMMPGGGYCFAPTHALQDNSPTENVLAMYDTALRCGAY